MEVLELRLTCSNMGGGFAGFLVFRVTENGTWPDVDVPDSQKAEWITYVDWVNDDYFSTGPQDKRGLLDTLPPRGITVPATSITYRRGYTTKSVMVVCLFPS